MSTCQAGRTRRSSRWSAGSRPRRVSTSSSTQHTRCVDRCSTHQPHGIQTSHAYHMCLSTEGMYAKSFVSSTGSSGEQTLAASPRLCAAVTMLDSYGSTHSCANLLFCSWSDVDVRLLARARTAHDYQCISCLQPHMGCLQLREARLIAGRFVHAVLQAIERGCQFVLLGSAPDPKVQAEFDDLNNELGHGQVSTRLAQRARCHPSVSPLVGGHVCFWSWK